MKNQTVPFAALQCLWLTESQTAQRLGMSQKWLQKNRLVGGGAGPRFAKFGSAVRYSLADIQSYERECLRTSTSCSGQEVLNADDLSDMGRTRLQGANCDLNAVMLRQVDKPNTQPFDNDVPPVVPGERTKSRARKGQGP